MSMALKNQSLFLYGYQVSNLNNAIDFIATSGGPTLQATLRFGFYSLSTLLQEIVFQMQIVDSDHNYLATADRSLMGGTQNRVTITQQSGTFLSLLFSSGPRAATSASPLIGFQAVDQTGAITYTGTATSGIILVPTYPAYNYLGPDFYEQVFGAVNVSVSGIKEAIVFQIQKFIQAQFKFETEARWQSQWLPMMTWLIQQRPFDFTPDITVPNTLYNCTLERDQQDGKGLGFKPNEMLPDFPFEYDLGIMEFRVTPLL